ncbi:MAG TPA: hypothetical protein DIC53_10945 [Synergistaceae bacterium]|jgi:hypothetical protein|nr:hypothetical protein [Synergistaceae bacterium]
MRLNRTLPREVPVRVGKKAYFLETALDDDTLARVSGIMSEVADEFADGLDQEQVLLLSCLQLAWTLDKIGSRLGQAMGTAEEGRL